MSHILKDYQETHRYEIKKNLVSAKKLQIAVYTLVSIFVIYVFYERFHRNEKKVEPTKKVLKTEARNSYV